MVLPVYSAALTPSSSPIPVELSMRALLSTVAAAAGWTVVSLHGNKANPGMTSLPDLMLTREGDQPLMVKAMGPKGELSGPQQAYFNHYKGCGFRCLSFRPQDIAEVFEVLT